MICIFPLNCYRKQCRNLMLWQHMNCVGKNHKQPKTKQNPKQNKRNYPAIVVLVMLFVAVGFA